MPLIKILSSTIVRGAKYIRDGGIRFDDWDKPLKWSHAGKLKELKTDGEVSKEYLTKLIKGSSKKGDIHRIMNYLFDNAKTANLANNERGHLLSLAKDKLEQIDYKEFVQLLKENLHHFH